eukprot:TRINITY_DN7356_c0_g4_i1.p1 TRINITY_DN7356_c0_g4~~TRINITY_DN7356_c0_g4_i1.p1  ORF type:complete len:552 (+),score=25.67 TRINITY_DN7356_c0_g4_i1:67-1722(+)
MCIRDRVSTQSTWGDQEMKGVLIGILGIVALASLASAATFCPNGKWLKSDKTCQDCPLGCNLCNAINDQPNCISCSFKKALDLSGSVGVCVDCVINCEKCTGPRPDQCIEAKVGYGIKNGTKDLIPCPSNCHSCSSEKKCATCSYGYFLENQTCISCPANCMKCKKEKETDTAPKCLVCNSGYTLVADGKSCKACDHGCAECTETKCIKPMPKFYISKSDLVSSCPDNCLSCGDSRICTRCFSEFIPTSYGWCERCSNLFAGCNACQNDRCTACSYSSSKGRRYNLVDGKCIQCPEGCDKCTDSNTCLLCFKNFKLEADKKCKALTVMACLEPAETFYKCKTCLPAYRLNADQTSCNFINCGSGYGLNAEGNCVPTTILNCKKSDERDKRCIEPVIGYYATGSETKPCPKGCYSCHEIDNSVHCFEAAKASNSDITTQITNGVVHQCHESCGGCLKPGDPNSCATCRPGRTLALHVTSDISISPRFCMDVSIDCPQPQRPGGGIEVCYTPSATGGSATSTPSSSSGRTASSAEEKKSAWSSFVDKIVSWFR